MPIVIWPGNVIVDLFDHTQRIDNCPEVDPRN